jgi:outer membrane protein insertion porin family
MRSTLLHITWVCLLTGITSCGVSRHLPPGEKLYDGASIKIIKAPEVKTGSKVLKNKLASLARPKRNKQIFGQPYKVWWWYKIGPSKKEKGFKTWFRNALGDPPVLTQDLNPSLNAKNMEVLLNSEGYFNSRVKVDSLFKKNEIRLQYSATVTSPYFFGPITWRLDSSQLTSHILQLPADNTFLKTGDQYDEQKLKAEKERLARLLKGKGYYYFEAAHLLSYIDTNHNNQSAAVYLTMNEPLTANAKTPFTINKIIVQTPFTTFDPVPDSVVQALPQKDGIYVYDRQEKFKPDVFSRSITYRMGSIYSLPEQNKTQIRLNSLGAFRFVKPQFSKVEDSPDKLNVTYFLAPYQKRKLQTELGGFTRSNNYTGGQLSVEWANKNLFKRAESLVIKATGSFEITPNDSLKDNNNWRLGLEATLNVPRFLAPFRAGHKSAYFPKTSFPLSFDWVRHQGLYTEKYFNARYELSWRDSANREFRLTPMSLTISNTANFTNTFEAFQKIDTTLKFTLPTNIIPSLVFQYIVSKSSSKKYSTFLHTGVDLAGNILGLVKGNNGYFSTKVGNAYFSQFVKADIDFRYYLKLKKELTWANRLFIGASYPYGNSPFLPFSRQFIIGGANSLRGFLPRRLGPGSAQPTEIQQSSFPQIGGDFKLELNTELRTSLGGRFKGAVFIDAGNIWMKDSILYTSAGQLTKDFYKQIAMDVGLGIRMDVKILVIRLDLGIPFYKPWLDEGQRWTFNLIKVGDKEWRKDNFIWNFALGYPF